MLNEFIKFITDDPIMLGLCCAIVVLVFAFIIILLFGGKKKEKEVENNKLDNTASLLKSDIQDEPLRSTQEYNVSELTGEKALIDTQKLPEIEDLRDNMSEENAPISLEEANKLKVERENEATKDTIEIPVVTESEPTPVVVPSVEPTPVVETPVVASPAFNPMPEVVEEPKVEPTPVEPSIPVFASPAFNPMPEPTPIETQTKTPAPSAPATPVVDIPTFEFPDFGALNSTPTNNVESPVVKEEPVVAPSAPAPQTFSSVYVQEPTPVQVTSPVVDDLDDIDLPKLNTKESTSVLNTLTGEDYNL